MKRNKNFWWLDIALLVLISAIAYLPDVLSLSYYRDDWYYMYDGLIGGPRIFEVMFLHLRPARGPFYATLFSLFGNSPIFYHFSLFFWRIMGGMGMFWLFDTLWPKQRNARFFTALMFTIYPGFLWWVAGVEYQPMVFSLGIHIFSIVLTLKSIQALSLRNKIIWYVLAILTGWYALALVDYAIGMEVFRWMAIFLLVHHNQFETLWLKKILASIKLAVPSLIIPILYLAWRQLFFDNWRNATDVGLQLSEAFYSLSTMLWSFIYLLQSVLNVSVFAWGVPFGSLFYANRLKEMTLGIGFAILGLVIALVVEHSFSEKIINDENPSESWVREAILLGIAGTIVGVLPIVLANRTVAFGRFSHYTLPASIAGVLFLTGIVYSLKDKFAKIVALSLVVTLAILTHRGLSSTAKTEADVIKNFWWQMSWRAPDLQNGVLLLVAYPFDYFDDSDVVFGPANFIYYPELQTQIPIKLSLNSIAIQGDTVQDIMLGRKERIVNYYDAHEAFLDYGNVMIISQPLANTCLRVIDPRWTNFSKNDRGWVIEGAQKSRIENIVPSGATHLPPEYLFGAEPDHEWCYYFQKADLARQVGDWETIVSLFDEAKSLLLTPNDQIELIPFLQAYAYLGDTQKVKQIASIINAEDWYKLQACQSLQSMEEHGYPLNPDMQVYSAKLFCGSGE